jgi:hypothetical protein
MDLIETCRMEMEKLARAGASEPWLSALLAEAPANRELYRDPDHGFLLLAHTEPPGLYRVPHDHGRSWVVYAVVHGAVDMGSYGWIDGAAGPELVRQSSTVMSAGDVQVYLPGDVHDTICLTGPALLLRFTARDLQVEKAEGRLTRYVEQNGRWTAQAA